MQCVWWHRQHDWWLTPTSDIPEVSNMQLIDGGVSPRGSREECVRSPALRHCHVVIHRRNLHTTIALSGKANSNKLNYGSHGLLNVRCWHVWWHAAGRSWAWSCKLNGICRVSDNMQTPYDCSSYFDEFRNSYIARSLEQSDKSSGSSCKTLVMKVRYVTCVMPATLPLLAFRWDIETTTCGNRHQASRYITDIGPTCVWVPSAAKHREYGSVVIRVSTCWLSGQKTVMRYW